MSTQIDKNEKMKKLIDFIEEYAEEFLEDGTKEYVIQKLKNGDTQFAVDLMNCMDKEWVERTKEIKKFYLLTDAARFDQKGNLLRKPYYGSSYLDSLQSGESHVPTLREVRPMGVIDNLRRNEFFPNLNENCEHSDDER